MNETAIIWTEATWNPVSGCKKISQGCSFCYAHTLSENKRGTKAFPNGFDLTLRPHKLREPLKLKQPSLIFVNSMSDMFWEEISDDYRLQILDIIRQTPQHQYQVLTKRPGKMLEFSQEHELPDNFWAGVTIENKKSLYRLDLLKQVKSKIKFISIEPLLEDLGEMDLSGIDWIITGGESGFHIQKKNTTERSLVENVSNQWTPREDRIPWVRSIRDQCIDQEVNFFHKQWGGPFAKSGGREIDGRVWDEIPIVEQINNKWLKNESKTAC